MRLFIIPMLIVSLTGCGSKASLKKAPVAVSGSVSQGGQPIGGLVMIFQPLGDGHVREFPIQKDGSFSGELISGKYAYYVAKPAAPAAAQALRNLAPKYFEADLSRTVAVESGNPIAIELN
ncbi:MAG TPA: hypothetical protein VHK01_17865 [Lacipirellulaceae bacterium]|jgi:hypothetical protein|nr:hypothetical protein [Lacipirellulaceae bacterium]